MGFFEIFSAGLAGLYAFIPNYGLAIILLTLLVRIVLLPLTIRQTRSMREMQMIQPEIKRIQAKNKGNRQKMNEEMMALYKEHGVNPLGGCLPLLLQMPVFIALFNVLRQPLAYMGYKASNGNGFAPLGGLEGIMRTVQDSSLAHGLSEVPDKINTFLYVLRLDCTATASMPFGGAMNPEGPPSVCDKGWVTAIPYLLLIAVMGFSTMYSQKQLQASRPPGGATDTASQQQQLMMKIMPLMFVVFGFGFPAGLTLYWTTSNLWTIVQQAMMIRLVPHKELPGKPKGEGAKAALSDDGVATGKNKGAQKGQKSSGSRSAKPTSKPGGGSRQRQGKKKKKR